LFHNTIAILDSKDYLSPQKSWAGNPKRDTGCVETGRCGVQTKRLHLPTFFARSAGDPLEVDR
jgi:hypothetical protein